VGFEVQTALEQKHQNISGKHTPSKKALLCPQEAFLCCQHDSKGYLTESYIKRGKCNLSHNRIPTY
jgi:hypothetical protein